MKSAIKIVIMSLLVSAWLTGIMYDAVIKPPQSKWTFSMTVISKGEQDEVQHHKSYSAVVGKRRTFLCKSTQFGYGEVPVTVNTYMTTKVGDNVTFTFNRREMQEDFSYSDGDISLFRDWTFILVVGAIVLIVIGAIMWSKFI